ncbi:MAG: dual specificity protein phosphatase family protein [Anaerolineae bacterium]|nr:dual specificity protein phosphatase family protein [Anaerolineae bacterium]
MDDLDTYRWPPIIDPTEDPEEVLSRFVHEFKHPINSIQGYARLILKGHANTREIAEIIYKMTERMQAVQDAVLDYLRFEGARKTDLNQIRPWLFIGKYRQTRSLPLLQSYNIGAMLQLAELVEQPGIDSLYLPIEDGEPLSVDLLKQGIDFIRHHHDSGHRVLIACGAGISRSAAFAMAALKEIESLGLLEALRAIKQVYPKAMPHMALWESLCAYYQEDVSFWDTLS